jgi:hypothetical protein
MKITHRILITFFASLSFFVAANIISFFFFASRAYEIFIISQASDQVQKDNNLAKIIQETPLNSHDKAEYKEVFRSLDAISSGISDSTRVLSKSTNESIRSSFSNILLY